MNVFCFIEYVASVLCYLAIIFTNYVVKCALQSCLTIIQLYLVLKSQLHPELLLYYFKEQIPFLKDNFKNFQVINLKWTRATEKCLFINIVRTLEAKTEVKIVTDC